MSSERTLEQWLQWLENTRPEKDIELGLDRVSAVGRRLGVLKPAPLVVTVAGTNGKGSCVALLEAILRNAGYRVGAFTSPHLFRFNERVRINGQEIGDDALCQAFAEADEIRGDIHLTYFEFTALAAFYCFLQARLDIVILEVGMGGRLDATNIIDPDVSVIATVGLDHQEWLGNTVEEIAREKAGIMRSGIPAVYGDDPVPSTIIEHAINREAPLFRRNREFSCSVKGTSWDWFGLGQNGEKMVLPRLPVPTLFLDNAATVIQALQFLPMDIGRAHIEAGLKSAGLPGRFQTRQVKSSKGHLIDVILDVSHNPQAGSVLVSRLQQEKNDRSVHAVLAMCKDKNYGGFINQLLPYVDSWSVSQFDSPRALSTVSLQQLLMEKQANVIGYDSIDDAFHAVINASNAGDCVLVTGSFMTVAPVLAMIDCM